MRAWWEQTREQSGLSRKDASYWLCPPYWAISVFHPSKGDTFLSFLPGFYLFCLSCTLYCSLAVISLRISWVKGIDSSSVQYIGSTLIQKKDDCSSLIIF